MDPRTPRPASPVRWTLALSVALASLTHAPSAGAHHEALFGPQSSLAVESSGFLSLQTHTRAYGLGDSRTQETTYILSGGISPIAEVPWSITLVQPFTYQTTRSPTPPGSTGPFSACDGCLRRENNLIATSYRFDLTSLQRAFGKDGNFALVSAALEPPTGDKDYAPLRGPFNAIFAGMLGFEWSHFAAIGLGYYRLNASDDAGSKKGNNVLAGVGFGYTPVDDGARLFSVQLGMAAELHERDVLARSTVSDSGGWEVFASPTVVWAPAQHMRFFTYVSLPFAQDYRSPTQEDRWRAGLGVIYSFERDHVHGVAAPHPHGGIAAIQR